MFYSEVAKSPYIIINKSLYYFLKHNFLQHMKNYLGGRSEFLTPFPLSVTKSRWKISKIFGEFKPPRPGGGTPKKFEYLDPLGYAYCQGHSSLNVTLYPNYPLNEF